MKKVFLVKAVVFSAILTLGWWWAREVGAAQPGTNRMTAVNTVFVIALENHNFTQPTPGSSPEQLLGNPAAPYSTA